MNDNNKNEELINNNKVLKNNNVLNNDNNNENKNNNAPHFIKSTELRLPQNLQDISYDKPNSG